MPYTPEQISKFKRALQRLHAPYPDRANVWSVNDFRHFTGEFLTEDEVDSLIAYCQEEHLLAITTELQIEKVYTSRTMYNFLYGDLGDYEGRHQNIVLKEWRSLEGKHDREFDTAKVKQLIEMKESLDKYGLPPSNRF